MKDHQLLLESALTLHQGGNLDGASAIYKKILSEDCRNAKALHQLGVVALQTHNYQLAFDLINQVITQDPNKPIYFFNLGLALSGLNRQSLAIESYDKAIFFNQNYHEAYYNKGILLQELNEQQLAVDAFVKAIKIKPDFVMAYFSLGNAFKALELFDEAILTYYKAINLRPNYAEAYSNLGLAFKAQKKIENALKSYDIALSANPLLAEAYFNRGNTYLELGELGSAIESFNKAFEIQPEMPWLLGLLMRSNAAICDWSSLDLNLLLCEAQIKRGLPVIDSLTALMLFDDPQVHLLVAKTFTELKFPKNYQLKVSPMRQSCGRIKIGYYSADLHYHPVSIWLAEQLENHDKERFELFAFCFKLVKDPMQERLHAAFDHWIDAEEMSDVEVVELSRNLGIDIALDLNGHTGNGRPGIFAARAAPIQVNHLGFPGSMGSDYIDYMLTQLPNSEKKMEITLEYFSENMAYVPSIYTYDRSRKIGSKTPTRKQYGLPEKGFVFTCQNGSQKIMPEVFSIWMEILKAVPGSVLWLLKSNESAVKNLIKEAEVRGVESHRLIFTAREVISIDQEKFRVERYLASYKLADLFLDTWPYNAGTTAVDALWAGLPLLTKSGIAIVSRMASDALETLQVPELTAETPEEYRMKAINLALDPLKIIKLKQKIQANRITSSLFDAVANTRYIEDAYLEMYRRHIYGQKPSAIFINRKSKATDN